CELHERDAVAIWWYNRLSRPGIDLDALADPYVDELRRTYARHQREVWVLDISTDLAMPCCAAISRRDHEIEDVVFGFGAHPDPVLAVRAALMEMDQPIPLVGGRDDHGATRYATRDPAALRWFQTATCRSEPWLRPRAGPPTVLPGALVDPTVPAWQVLDFYVEDLRRAGIEVVVVDQTRPDIDLHVVRVLAPGMRHFWRRTAPGRLFDVPVSLGWRPSPTQEQNLNPWSVFL
ncbi:MAG TPA: YcaO-like family protein, partial [Mycobacteriales bacterium]